jgi:DNA-binding transcriptional regulator GbsR (MarR family)
MIMEEKLREAQDKFINGIARVTELMGLSDATGRIYGFLYMSPLPVSLDDICERLSLTKGTVSLYLRQMEDKNLIKRTWVGNTRKKFYEVRTDLWEVMVENFQQKFKKRFDVTLATVDDSMRLIEESLGEVEEEERHKALLIINRLAVLKEFHLKGIKFLETFLLEKGNLDKEIRKIDIKGD